MAKSSDPQWGKVAGIGLELAVGVAVGYFAGVWLNRRFGWKHADVVGLLVGFVAGMYLIIKQAIEINRRP
jgi:F0F1-type ATP synthase assembly protein I